MHDQAIFDYLAPRLTPTVERLSAVLNTDLYAGPVYIGPDGEECSWGDEGARQFDFHRAVGILSLWCDRNIPLSLYVEDWCGIPQEDEPQGYEEEGEWVEPESYWVFERKDLLRVLFGKELAQYL